MNKNSVWVVRPAVNDRNHRRQFLQLGGMGVIGTGLLMACTQDEEVILTEKEKPTPNPRPQAGPDSDFDLGEGDVGLLNYLYILAQLEAEFYGRIDDAIFTPAFEERRILFKDLYLHALNHRELLKALITAEIGTNSQLILPSLEFDFHELTFTSAGAIFNISKQIEDLSVGAYNGVGKLFSNPDYLVLVGNIASVKARHAAIIMELLNRVLLDFVVNGVIDVETGLERALKPSEVLVLLPNIAFIQPQITMNFLP